MEKHFFRTPSFVVDQNYLIFKTCWIKLVFLRFPMVWFFVFFFTALFFALFLDEWLGIAFLYDWMNENQMEWHVAILIVSIYLNFFHFNYTLKIGNGYVKVYRFSFLGRKVGAYSSLNHALEVTEISTSRGNIKTFIAKRNEKKRGKVINVIKLSKTF